MIVRALSSLLALSCTANNGCRDWIYDGLNARLYLMDSKHRKMLEVFVYCGVNIFSHHSMSFETTPCLF